MKNTSRNSLVVFSCAMILSVSSSATPPESPREDLLLKTMQQELTRAQTELGKLDPAPYYISYSVRDENSETALASLGSLVTSGHFRRRAVDVIMRVGKPELDNAHGENRASAITSGTLPLDD